MLNKKPLNDKTLRAAFHRFNHAYFDGKLPKDIQVRFASSKIDRKLVGAAIGINYTYDKLILMNKRYQHSRRIILSTLLHEMVHTKTYRNSLDTNDCDLTGWNSFNLESLRIAKLGAFNGLW